MPAGVLVVDKPRGPTSHDVVAILRRAFKTRQVGHCGTLDPMATGVLVVAIDDGTKLVSWLTSEDKAYEATLRLGIETDTLDAEGIETQRAALDAELVSALEDLERRSSVESDADLAPILVRALGAERDRTEQIPPVYSAIRVGGERAHALARRGEAPEMAPRPIEVKNLRIVAGGRSPEPHLVLSLDVTKGYFVRSLARDLAAALGTVGHLTALRRTRSGAFGIEDAVSLDGLWSRAEPDVPAPSPEALVEIRARKNAELAAALVPMDRAAARSLPISVLDEAGVVAAGHGKRIAPENLRDPHPCPSAWLDDTGRLVAIGVVEADGTGRVLRGFPPSRS